MTVKGTVPKVRKVEPAEESRPFWKGLDPWWLLFVGVVAIGLWLVQFRADPYRRIVIFLKDGLWVTIGITVVSFFFIVLVGLLGGLGRISKNPLVKGIASVYVEIIRGIPMLVQLMFIYYASPIVIRSIGLRLAGVWPALSAKLVNIRINPFGAAVLGLTICYGAYMSEIFRAGIESIPKGQMEAARSLGMSYFQAMRFVILPQAVQVILPPVGNEFVALLKDSSLVSVVAVTDLTRRGREFMASTFMALETWLMVALVYLVMTLFLSRLVAHLEERSNYTR